VPSNVQSSASVIFRTAPSGARVPVVLKALLDAVEGLGEGLPRHGLGVAVQQARIEKRLQHHRHAADLV